MECENKTITIESLPDEIILMILRNVDCVDIIKFSSTCSRYNDVIKGSHGLWKTKFQQIVPNRLFKNIERNHDGDWYKQTVFICTTQRRLYRELEAMSPNNFLRTDTLSISDVRQFFDIALTNSTTYFYTIHLLQELLKKGKRLVDNYVFQKPFTLTEMYYAKLAVRQIIHTFLTVKWVKSHKLHQLDPVVALNLFIQWIDTENLYLEEDVHDQMNLLAAEVLKHINARDSTTFTIEEILEKTANCPKTERSVLEAVSAVIYQERCMTLSSTDCGLESFNIVKVLKNKIAIRVVMAAIYQGVASRLGVQCELVSFPNHLFLEWQDNSRPERPQYYTVDLADGKLYPKRTCPFSDRLAPAYRQRYSPDSLIQYAASFVIYNEKNILTKNVDYLLDFLVRRQDKNNPYVLPFLLNEVDFRSMKSPLSIINPSPAQLELIATLTSLYTPSTKTYRNMTVKLRNGSVKYAVGMVCYHRKYDYVCVIRGWDATCMIEWNSASEIDSLERGVNQPFYIVVAVDQHERYVAEENLRVVTPSRLLQLEDIIGREFSFFDGFAYVPNEQKLAEYPEDYIVSNQYKNKLFGRTARFSATVPNLNEAEGGVIDGNY